MFEGLLCAQSFAGINLEQLPDEILGLVRDEDPVGVMEGELSTENGTKLARVVRILEGLVPTENGVNNDPDSPHVDLEVVAFWSSLEDLRGSVLEGTALFGERLTRLDDCGESKVSHEDVARVRLLQKDVLRLEVAMYHVPLVEEGDGLKEVLGDVLAATLSKGTVLDQGLKKLTTRGKLENDGPLLLSLIDLNDFDDVWMVEDAVDLDLGADEVLLACEVGLVDLLHRKAHSIALPRGGIDCAEVTGAKRLKEFVVLLEIVLFLRLFK
jgi:hypothetical protein